MKNILWVDDDVNRITLLSDRVELEKKGFNIIAIDNVDDFLKFIKTNTNTIDCVILDMHMATGSFTREETQNGIFTGIALYRQLLKSRYREVKIAVYTVFKQTDFENFWGDNEITFIPKSIKSSEFADRITELVNE